MAMNHFSRLLRLARRTGDRLIVTDERSNEEPLVILPLDEYEALVDGAFGPVVDHEDETGERVGGSLSSGMGSWQGETGDEIEDIQLEDDEVDDIAIPIVPDVEASEVSEGDEAEIDEEALKPLWEAPKLEKNIEKSKEIKQESPKKTGDGEEGFYLESID